MQILDIKINGTTHYAIHDPIADDILDFGQGAAGLRAAVEFMNAVFLAEHAAELAGFAD